MGGIREELEKAREEKEEEEQEEEEAVNDDEQEVEVRVGWRRNRDVPIRAALEKQLKNGTVFSSQHRVKYRKV
jgi:hypothetical protein